MKRIKIVVSAFLLLGTLATLTISCSNDEAIKTNQNASLNTNLEAAAKPSEKSAADIYVSNFYNTSYTYGRSIDTNDEDGRKLIVDEVIIDELSEARGYVVTSNGNFVYFVDVDRTNKTMTTYEAKSANTETISNIDSNEDYVASGKFDLIKVVDDVNNDNLTAYINITLPKFWGSDDPRKDGPHRGIYPGSNPPRLACWNIVQPTKRRFFIRFNDGPSFPEEIPCP